MKKTVAVYTNPPSGSPYDVRVLDAADAKSINGAANFKFNGRGVYAKPSTGIFAYLPNTGYRPGDTAEETQAHQMAKAAIIELLSTGVEIAVHQVRKASWWRDPVIEPFTIRAVAWREEACIKCGPRSWVKPDVFIQAESGYAGCWINFEAQNTHAVDYGKRKKLKLLRITTVEVDVQDFLGRYQSDAELKSDMIQQFTDSGIYARVLTLAGEHYSRPADDHVFSAAIRGN